MKKAIILGLAAVAGLSLTSCDDFLNDNRYPKTSIVDNPNYWSNAANAQLQCDRYIDEFSAAYGSAGGQGWFYYQTLNDDQVGSGFADWTYPTLMGEVSDWSYSKVRGANIIISGVESSTLTGNERNNYLAIGRLIRAYSYYQLVRKFGDVVWEDFVVEPESEILYAKRDNRDEVMDKVFADLDFAIANIIDDHSATTWSKDYARAIKSEVALYEGTFCRYRTLADNGLAPNEERAKKYLAESAAASEVLLASHGFCDDYHSIYNSLWTEVESTVVPGEMITGLNNNPELIWGRRYDKTNGRHSTISYTASSTTTSGMSLDAFKAFLFKDGQPMATTTCNKTLVGEPTTFDGAPAYSIQNLLDEREARLSIITDPYVYYKGMEWSRAGCSGMNSSSGFGIAKYDNVLLPVNDRTNSANNYTSCPIYWTSYIALNYAEAKAELGQFGDTEFNKSLKKLYERAGLPMVNSVAYLSNLNDPANNMGVSSLLWEIRRCRRCELMYDNWIRYWDLVRWHQLDKLDSTKNPDILRGAYAANAPVANATVDSEGFIRPYPGTNRVYNKKYYLYPIPTGQINLNGNLGQNPGW